MPNVPDAAPDGPIVPVTPDRAAPPSAPIDIRDWALDNVVRCCAGLRDCTAGAETTADAAQAIVEFLREAFRDPATGDPAFVLARLFVTQQLRALPDDLQQWATMRLDEPAADDPRCLVLLGTDGDLPEWCDRGRSVGHKAIPLPSGEAVRAAAPMVAAVIDELGAGVDAVVAGDPTLGTDRVDFDVFHVADAVGSPTLPGQAFVVEHGIRSALGFGGVLPSGDLFAAVLFSRVPVSRASAELFRTVAVSTKLALLPYDTAPLLPGLPARREEQAERAQRARIAALEQMLTVHEHTAAAQATALRRESETVETLRQVGELLTVELDLDKVVQLATDAAVEVTGAAFGAFFYNVENLAGESYMLYTIAGVPRSAFERFPMPRNTAVFAPTFTGDGIVRSDDITADERYGHSAPHYGMPPGHLPVRSYLAVPVISLSGQVRGGFFFGHPATGVFDDRSQRLAAGIATQTAAAMDNAELFRKQRDTALELQRALLPPVPPAFAGLRVSHTYLPGMAGLEVGGDWYDMIPLDDHLVALVIGDVMGRGVRAAATMGQLRSAIRALATLRLAPERVLAQVNELVLGFADEHIVTAVYGVLDTRERTLTFANAGHLPPLVREAGGGVRFLDDQLGPPLGIPAATFGATSVALPPGFSVVLYTDGLVETRERGVEDGLAELRRALEAYEGPPGAICDAAVDSLTGPGERDDDVAVLVVTDLSS